MITVRPPRLTRTANKLMDEALDTLVRWLITELGKRTPDDTVRESVLLRSPDGSAWEVKVDDLGALTVTKIGPA